MTVRLSEPLRLSGSNAWGYPDDFWRRNKNRRTDGREGPFNMSETMVCAYYAAIAHFLLIAAATTCRRILCLCQIKDRCGEIQRFVFPGTRWASA